MEGCVRIQPNRIAVTAAKDDDVWRGGIADKNRFFAVSGLSAFFRCVLFKETRAIANYDESETTASACIIPHVTG